MKSLMSIIVFDIHVRHPHGRKSKLNVKNMAVDGSFQPFLFIFFHFVFVWPEKVTLLIAIVVAQMQ